MTEDMLDFPQALHRAGTRFLVIGATPWPSWAGPVVHPEDFKAPKRAFGRPVDLRDLEEL